MRRGADFSADGIYRYRLWRRWGSGAPPPLVWVMLNPSTADAERDDPTIRRCIGFSKVWGFGAMEVVNLFALRATEPGVVRGHAEPVGPGNDAAIAAALKRAACVVVAWGAFEWARGRAVEVLAMLGRGVECLGVTAAGWPRHPLYVARSARRAAFVRGPAGPL